jgi:amino acid permease
MIFTIIITITQSYWYIKYYNSNIYKENDPNTWIDYFDIKKGFTKQLYFFRTFANIFFAYSYHAGILPILSTLKKNDIKRKSKIINFSILWYTSMYFLLGVIGFFSYPINTPDLIIQREKIFSSDWIINIGRALIISALILKFPVNFKPFKLHLYTILFYNKENRMENKALPESGLDNNLVNGSGYGYLVSNTFDNIITILASYLAALLAVLFTNISNYFDIIGGICSINISVVIPCNIFFYNILFYCFYIYL